MRLSNNSLTLRKIFLRLTVFTVVVVFGLLGSAFYFLHKLENAQTFFDSIIAVDSDLYELRISEQGFIEKGTEEKAALFEKAARQLESQLSAAQSLTTDSSQTGYLAKLTKFLKV